MTCIAIGLLASAWNIAEAQVIRVTVERQECNDGRYCRRVRDCGTGVVIASDYTQWTYALTAAHVVRHAGHLRVQETAAARVIARDDNADIAVIEISGGYTGKVAAIGSAESGEAVYLCGYGAGELTRADCVLSSPQWITATARDGDSGGPVFETSTDRVIGIATAVHKSGNTLIVPAATVRSFCLQHCPQAVASQDRKAPIAAIGIPDPERAARIALLESRLAAAESLLLRMKQQAGASRTIVGPPGNPGRDGKPGLPGKDAVVSPLTVTLNTLGDDGQIVSTTTKTYQPGEPLILNFKPIPSPRD